MFGENNKKHKVLNVKFIASMKTSALYAKTHLISSTFILSSRPSFCWLAETPPSHFKPAPL